MSRHPALRCRAVGEDAAGTSLIELVIALAVAALLLTVALPRIDNWSGQLRLDLASAELVGALRMARSHAIRRNTNVAVKFRPGANAERATFTLYVDGDGNGVLNRDIDRGIDPQIEPTRDLAHLGGRIRFGFPPGLVPTEPGSGRSMTRLGDPIRFNNSDLASFGALGTGTPGTLYVTDGYWLFAVRVYNRSGKVQVLRYQRATRVWRGAR